MQNQDFAISHIETTATGYTFYVFNPQNQSTHGVEATYNATDHTVTLGACNCGEYETTRRNGKTPDCHHRTFLQTWGNDKTAAAAANDKPVTAPVSAQDAPVNEWTEEDAQEYGAWSDDLDRRAWDQVIDEKAAQTAEVAPYDTAFAADYDAWLDAQIAAEKAQQERENEPSWLYVDAVILLRDAARWIPNE